jgi:hypothetical protein
VPQDPRSSHSISFDPGGNASSSIRRIGLDLIATSAVCCDRQ